MSARNRLFLWTLLLLVLALGAAWDRYPLADAAGRLALLPKSGPGFASVSVSLTPQEIDTFGDTNVEKRLYESTSGRLLITAVDGSRDRHAVHDPMYCFRGSGWEPELQETVAVPGGEARWVRLQKHGQEIQALYWFSDGRRRHGSAPHYWWQTTLRRLTLGASGPEPVLVVVQSLGRESPGWRTLFDRFPALQEL
jgi:hypothetical protein